MPKIVKIDDENNLIVSIKLGQCDNCKEPMLRKYTGWTYEWQDVLTKSKIREETYQATGICGVCLEEGKSIQVQCDVGDTKLSFPDEFAYKLTHRSEYADGVATYEYVCKICVRLRPHEVIGYMANADEIEEVGKDTSYRDY